MKKFFSALCAVIGKNNAYPMTVGAIVGFVGLVGIVVCSSSSLFFAAFLSGSSIMVSEAVASLVYFDSLAQRGDKTAMKEQAEAISRLLIPIFTVGYVYLDEGFLPQCSSPTSESIFEKPALSKETRKWFVKFDREAPKLVVDSKISAPAPGVI